MKTNGKNLKIALMLGGTSPEREVSKSSSLSIYKALQSLGHHVVLVDPAYGNKQPENVEDFFSPDVYTETSNRNYVEAVNSHLMDNVDLVFLGLHGKWGEDGTMQSLLELRGLKYTGSRILSSSISMDKHMSKILFQHYAITTPHWITVDKERFELIFVINTIKEKFGFPCVIKPNDQGSTVGLTICKDESEVEDALKLALQFSDKVLIEEYIAGYECTVAIIDNEATPVMEIKPVHELYDYECKYTAGMSEYIVPAQIPDAAAKNIQTLALNAFKALGCKCYGRVDFRVGNDFIPYCLEVNTLPGMTSTSLVPKMAEAVGISFEQLIDKIIQLSL